MEGSIRRTVLICQENLGHKMWGVAKMTTSEVHRDIRPFEKSVHLLVCSSAKKVFFTGFRQTSPARLFCTMRYDCLCPLG
jgi:hypothetical protein